MNAEDMLKAVVKEILKRDWGRDPTEEELSKWTGVSQKLGSSFMETLHSTEGHLGKRLDGRRALLERV